MLDIPSGADDARKRLLQFLQEDTPLLLGIISSYVIRMGIARGEVVKTTAADILQDTVFEALSHSDRFDPTTQPRAWILAIAANILKRQKVDMAKRHQREILMSDLSIDSEAISESDFFDQVIAHGHPGPDQDIEADEQAVEMLSLVSPDDREVLRLALLHDLDTNTLAQVLGVTPGAARVRLHRALNRLRTAWNKHETQRKEGKSNA